MYNVISYYTPKQKLPDRLSKSTHVHLYCGMNWTILRKVLTHKLLLSLKYSKIKRRKIIIMNMDVGKSVPS